MPKLLLFMWMLLLVLVLPVLCSNWVERWRWDEDGADSDVVGSPRATFMAEPEPEPELATPTGGCSCPGGSGIVDRDLEES